MGYIQYVLKNLLSVDADVSYGLSSFPPHTSIVALQQNTAYQYWGPLMMGLHYSYSPPLSHPPHLFLGTKQRLAGLPDADRRSEAAAMALRLASMLGLDESESEDEDDEGGDQA